MHKASQNQKSSEKTVLLRNKWILSGKEIRKKNHDTPGLLSFSVPETFMKTKIDPDEFLMAAKMFSKSFCATHVMVNQKFGTGQVGSSRNFQKLETSKRDRLLISQHCDKFPTFFGNILLWFTEKFAPNR